MAVRIGWSSIDLTPERPVFLCGQFSARVSQGVMDPITATVLAIDADKSEVGPMFLVSVDVVFISDEMLAATRENAKKLLPDLNVCNIIINATHTHTAPEPYVSGDSPYADAQIDCTPEDTNNGIRDFPELRKIEEGIMLPYEYTQWAADKIAHAIKDAWDKRAPGAIGYGLRHAVVGHNRRVCYYDDVTKMYGNTNQPNFSHFEGYEDHSVNILCTWNANKKLTGMVINVPCPSQDDESLYVLSADYWHNVRTEIRKRFGEDVHILGQPSGAGDQSPHLLINREAQARMWRLMGRTHREDLGIRIADAVSGSLPYIEKEMDWDPVVNHKCENVELTRRLLSQWDLDNAAQEAEQHKAEYDKLVREYNSNPESKTLDEWYFWLTHAYRLRNWNLAVQRRFETEKIKPTISTELHALRIGDIAMATNQFEYYLDYAIQIKARSKAIQTFVVQLAGTGTYLPTQRAVDGKGYGAVAASTPVGPEGGKQTVEWSLEAINSFFPDN